jgi:hypothetical protein
MALPHVLTIFSNSGSVAAGSGTGTGSSAVSLTGVSVYSVSNGLSGDCDSFYNLNASGTWDTSGSNGNPSTGGGSGTWLVSGSASDYEVSMSLSDNLSGGGTIGGDYANQTWMALSSNRSWSVSDTANAGGSNTRTGSVAIRLASSGVVLQTASIFLSADQEP